MAEESQLQALKTNVYLHNDDWVVIEQTPRRVALPSYTDRDRYFSMPLPWMVYLCRPAKADKDVGHPYHRQRGVYYGERRRGTVGNAVQSGYGHIQVFARTAPLSPEDERLYYPALNHVWPDCQPCSGAQGRKVTDPFDMIEHFYSSPFMDYGGCYNWKVIPKQARTGANDYNFSLAHMEQFSPEDLLSWKWTEYPQTLREVMAKTL